MTQNKDPSANAGPVALDGAQAQARMAQLHDDWQLDPQLAVITRRFTFKGFAKATQMANLCAWHGDKMDHHPDIAFGWGYCQVSYTTHDIGGLSERDFLCAARLDALVA